MVSARLCVENHNRHTCDSSLHLPNQPCHRSLKTNPGDMKHKGFGFAEFESAAAAASALQRLQGRAPGSSGRPLKLAPSSSEGGGHGGAPESGPMPGDRFGDVKDDRQILGALEGMTPLEMWV